ncbi:MAG TPA: Hsp20/alpha crystallin family protein [Chroococcales cyanobacterium]|jgi:HSP20 family protein
MALIRWQPFQELDTLHRQMDQIFNDLYRVDRNNQIPWQPAIELQNTDDTIILKAEVPGVEGKNLDVRVTREAVAISGEHRYEKKAEENGLFRSEFRYGKFQRVIPLPSAVQNDRVQADFTNGILTLTLPKLEAANKRVVKINLVEQPTAAIEAENEQPANNEQSVNTETNDVWDSPTAEPAAV